MAFLLLLVVDTYITYLLDAKSHYLVEYARALGAPFVMKIKKEENL